MLDYVTHKILLKILLRYKEITQSETLQKEKKTTCYQVDFDVPADLRIKTKESEKIELPDVTH